MTSDYIVTLTNGHAIKVMAVDELAVECLLSALGTPIDSIASIDKVNSN